MNSASVGVVLTLFVVCLVAAAAYGVVLAFRLWRALQRREQERETTGHIDVRRLGGNA